VLSLLVVAGRSSADDVEREELLKQMRDLAKRTEVKLTDAAQPAALVENPIFRYDDQPRRFIDATIWAWTDGGRPVAFQKIEAIEAGDAAIPMWQYCLASLTPEKLSVKWHTGRQFHAKAAGVSFSPPAKAPDVAEGNTQRKRQARELVRNFSARIVTDRRSLAYQEMRLLTTPLFDYVDPQTKQYLGSVFGFSTNGTNPDLLLVIEVRGKDSAAAWNFAPARMTTGGVTLKLHDEKVWECKSADDRELPLMTWTFFTLPRDRLVAGGQP
jgi:hypothetical protein